MQLFFLKWGISLKYKVFLKKKVLRSVYRLK